MGFVVKRGMRKKEDRGLKMILGNDGTMMGEAHFAAMEKFLHGDLAASCDLISKVLGCYVKHEEPLYAVCERLQDDLPISDILDGMRS